MSKKSGYNTNLGAEFHVMSILHRLGFDATLTLGNKKAVDIVVVPRKGQPVSIDVKGLAGKTGWPVDNLRAAGRRHYVVFLCFLDKIDEVGVVPEVYVVPSARVRSLTYNAPGGRKVVPLARLRDRGQKYRDGWRQLKSSG